MTAPVLSIHGDWETRSAVDLRTAGAYRYAEDDSTGIWCLAWSFGGKDRGIWRGGEHFPQRILDHVADGGRVVAHNASFERLIWNGPFARMMKRRMHVPRLTIQQMDCTVARCAAIGIPASLDHAGEVLRLNVRKDKAGHANMLVLARPKKIDPDTGSVHWNDTPERLAMQYAYCEQDVRTEEAVDERVPALSARERRVWELDQQINDRGVLLDVPTIKAAMAVVESEKARLDAAMKAATGGAVTALTQTKRLTEWLKDRGHPVDGLGKDNIQRTKALCAGDEAATAALAIRLEGAKSSTAKLGSMLACICRDGRARGLLAYHGASTGRWAGRLIQPQNMYRMDAEVDGDDVHMAVRMVPYGGDAIRLMTGQPPLTMLAKCLRSMIIAAPGHRFVGGDLSNIEGRIAAWIADEKWKIAAFRAYDQKTGPDLYRVAYARSFGVDDPATVSGARRQVGKVTELSLQYQGSVGAWIKMAANYGVQPADVVDVVAHAVPESAWIAMAERYAAATDKHELPADQWCAIKLIVAGWREAHPGIVQGWWDLQDAAIEATATPGAVVPVFGGRVRYLAARGFLWCALPSGRTIAYHEPCVVTESKQYFYFPDGERVLVESMTDAEKEEAIEAGAQFRTVTRRRVDYQGFEGERKRWATMTLYGGMQFNHVVQGTARDVMVEGMFEADERGYPIVLTVHDELLTECEDGFGSAAELEAIMSTVPSWIDGDLPLAAKAWEDKRYAK